MMEDLDVETITYAPIRPYVEQRLNPAEARLAVDLGRKYGEVSPYVASNFAITARNEGRLADEVTWRRIATCLFNLSLMEIPAHELSN